MNLPNNNGELIKYMLQYDLSLLSLNNARLTKEDIIDIENWILNNYDWLDIKVVRKIRSGGIELLVANRIRWWTGPKSELHDIISKIEEGCSNAGGIT